MVDFSKIKLFVMDVDGVLTDACMYYFNDGNEAKKFNFRDGMGIELIKSKGIRVAIITQENTNITYNRAKKLRLDACKQGIKDKASELDKLMVEFDLLGENLAFVGDDINDIQALQLAAISICPSDAVADVKAVCDIITEAKGGEGVIREVYEKYIKHL